MVGTFLIDIEFEHSFVNFLAFVYVDISCSSSMSSWLNVAIPQNFLRLRHLRLSLDVRRHDLEDSTWEAKLLTAITAAFDETNALKTLKIHMA